MTLAYRPTLQMQFRHLPPSFLCTSRGLNPFLRGTEGTLHPLERQKTASFVGKVGDEILWLMSVGYSIQAMWATSFWLG
jgi:hypothetical protein